MMRSALATVKSGVQLRPSAVLAALLVFPWAAAWAGAGAQRPDAELIAACAQEAEERLFKGVSGHHGAVVASGLTRSEREDLVNVTVASGEGRSISVTCKFRGGRLFDVRG
jgi:hypothetical protein